MSGHIAEYDVIIAGAGPAGSVTAASVAGAGYRVLVLEKNAACRSPCAGYISNTINMVLPDDCIVQSKITGMRTYFPDLEFHDFELNGFVVDRPSFDTALAKKAEDAGAEIKWGSPLVDINSRNVRFRGGEARGKIIVGADGVFSKTASLMGLGKQKIAVCAQYHLKGVKPVPGTACIFFNADYAPGGYVWIYPTGKNSVKAGVGITPCSKPPREYLDAFIRESPAFGGLKVRITEYITGALPVGGLREKLVSGNLLLAGDSAGMADPVTGAGINNAILSGGTAGRTIIEALENDDVAMLLRYEKRVRRMLGSPLARALEKRKRLDACVDNEMLREHLPELWVGFNLKLKK